MNYGQCTIDSFDLINWYISKSLINEKIYPLLYLDHESAGEFNINNGTKKVDTSVTIIEGSKDYVFSPNAVLNYHTHPISCYLQEKTVLGYPSGEDIRETIIFSLMGTVGHVVATVEGLYTVQLNPCILENLINLDSILNIEDCPKDARNYFKKNDISYISFMRGLIILVVEMVFRSSHVFRSYSFAKYRRVLPSEYVFFIENFKLKNILNTTINNHNGDILQNSIYVFENNKLEKISFFKYISEYEHNTKIDLTSSKGTRYDSGITVNTVLKWGLFDLLKDLDPILLNPCIRRNEKWTNKWFTMSLCYNEVIYNGKNTLYYLLDTESQWNYLKQSNSIKNNIKLIVDPCFFYYNMSGKCDYKSLDKNLRNLLKNHKHSNKQTRIVNTSLMNKKNNFGSWIWVDEEEYDDGDGDQNYNFGYNLNGVNYNDNENDMSDLVHETEDQDESQLIRNFDRIPNYIEEPDVEFRENFGKINKQSSTTIKSIKKSTKSTKTTKSRKKQIKDVLILYGSENCGYCVSAKNDIKKSKKYKLITKYYPDIYTAINQANKYKNIKDSKSAEIQSIPSIFLNGKLINHRKVLTGINWT